MDNRPQEEVVVAVEVEEKDVNDEKLKRKREEEEAKEKAPEKEGEEKKEEKKEEKEKKEKPKRGRKASKSSETSPSSVSPKQITIQQAPILTHLSNSPENVLDTLSLNGTQLSLPAQIPQTIFSPTTSATQVLPNASPQISLIAVQQQQQQQQSQGSVTSSPVNRQAPNTPLPSNIQSALQQQQQQALLDIGALQGLELATLIHNQILSPHNCNHCGVILYNLHQHLQTVHQLDQAYAVRKLVEAWFHATFDFDGGHNNSNNNNNNNNNNNAAQAQAGFSSPVPNTTSTGTSASPGTPLATTPTTTPKREKKEPKKIGGEPIKRTVLLEELNAFMQSMGLPLWNPKTPLYKDWFLREVLQQTPEQVKIARPLYLTRRSSSRARLLFMLQDWQRRLMTELGMGAEVNPEIGMMNGMPLNVIGVPVLQQTQVTSNQTISEGEINNNNNNDNNNGTTTTTITTEGTAIQ